MLSSFKTVETRREGVMRQIEQVGSQQDLHQFFRSSTCPPCFDNNQHVGGDGVWRKDTRFVCCAL
jgi:hypothetical protein